MKNHKSVILALLAVALAPAVVSVMEMDTDAGAGVRMAIATRTIESGALSVDPGNVSVTEHAGTVTVAPVVIVGHTARKAVQAVKGCDFASRALTQGRGNVRGFCL